MLELSTDEVLLKVLKLLKIDNPEKVDAEEN